MLKIFTYLYIIEFIDHVIQCWVGLVDVKEWLLFNPQEKEFGVLGHPVLAEVPVVDDPSRDHVLIICVALIAVVTGVICADTELAVDHPWK